MPWVDILQMEPEVRFGVLCVVKCVRTRVQTIEPWARARLEHVQKARETEFSP